MGHPAALHPPGRAMLVTRRARRRSAADRAAAVVCPSRAGTLPRVRHPEDDHGFARVRACVRPRGTQAREGMITGGE